MCTWKQEPRVNYTPMKVLRFNKYIYKYSEHVISIIDHETYCKLDYICVVWSSIVLWKNM